MTYDRSKITGKISLLTTFLGVGVLALGLLVDIPHANKVAQADTATTSVTVLNTPPQWVMMALEVPESSTSSPTNSGTAVNWQAVADDSSGDDYYLIVCKTSAAPTANNLAAPECAGGSTNRWVRTGRIVTNATATASYTTQESDPETNNWYAFVCDHNANSYCNLTYSQGTGTGTSPFKVNHRPTFSAYSVTSAINPGGVVGWSATSSDPDVLAGDTVQLFVCKGQTFTGSDCGASGTWCSSGASSTDPFCLFFASSTYPDAYYSAYGYIRDNYGHLPSGGQQGTNQRMTVNNVTPSIAAASVSLLDTDDTGPLILTVPGTTTPNFEVRFTVTDQNSCRTASSTDEIVESFTNVYRSGITSTGCDTSGEYNANNCYPGSINYGTWNLNCTASSTSCLGTSDADLIIQCTFPLWFYTESTDGTGVSTDPIYFAQNWLASAEAADNNGASSTLVESSAGSELVSFLAYDVATTSISYGGLQPGQSVDPVSKITDLQSVGNVGLDQTLYGTDMCPTYPTCTGNATSTIFVNNQKYASSTLAYASASTLLTNPGAEFEINVRKSTTSVPEFKNTYWGITVPGTITLSGDYIGQNTLIGITGESAAW
jgi:hypothetical protein